MDRFSDSYLLLLLPSQIPAVPRRAIIFSCRDPENTHTCVLLFVYFFVILNFRLNCFLCLFALLQSIVNLNVLV